jgi:hypothetical protein
LLSLTKNVAQDTGKIDYNINFVRFKKPKPHFISNPTLSSFFPISCFLRRFGTILKKTKGKYPPYKTVAGKADLSYTCNYDLNKNVLGESNRLYFDIHKSVFSLIRVYGRKEVSRKNAALEGEKDTGGQTSKKN